eukprot:XP_011446257.1 PREDICTED: cystatin-A-like [Crassostrea gigas]
MSIRVTFVCCVIAVSGAFAQLIPGGWTETRPIDPYPMQVVLSLKSDIVSRLNSMYITVNEFQPLLYRERVAVGAVYQVKIRIGYGRYVHVTIYQHFSGTPTEVQDIQTRKTLADPLT